MKRDSQRLGSSPAKESVADELDRLNAQTRAAHNAPNVLRRTIEARIEAAAKGRRSRETGLASRRKGAA